jgi:hypothetical protein
MAKFFQGGAPKEIHQRLWGDRRLFPEGVLLCMKGEKNVAVATFTVFSRIFSPRSASFGRYFHLARMRF